MKTIDLHIIDLVHNSIKAGANTIGISVSLNTAADLFTICVEDNGCGMNVETLSKVCDPYYTTRTERKVGLGVSLLKFQAELCQGKFTISSQEGKGTKVQATFTLSHPDRQGIGDIAGTLSGFICQFPDIHFDIQLLSNDIELCTSTAELKEALEFKKRFSNHDFRLIQEFLSSATQFYV